MPIKDVFGTATAAPPAPAGWAYDPAKTYLTGMGGNTQDATPGSYQVRLYSPVDDEWSGEEDTGFGTTGTNNYGWQAVTNKKYIICNAYGSPGKMSKYDPGSDTWTLLGVPPMALFQHNCACSDGITGVYVQEQNLKLWHWEETTDTWTALLAAPSISIPATSIARIGTKIYMFTASTVHEYDIPGNTWTANVAAQPSWFFVGGSSGSDGTGLIYWWQNNSFKSFDGTTFVVLAASPLDASAGISFNTANMAVHGGKVYVPTTALGASTYAHVSVYDIASNTWDANVKQTGQSHLKGLFVL
jgi:hypothetical protein